MRKQFISNSTNSSAAWLELAIVWSIWKISQTRNSVSYSSSFNDCISERGRAKKTTLVRFMET